MVKQLADLESSELLIRELYIDLRKTINEWAAITQQTAQARMGYVGQHLVSVVTGHAGGKSGARGRDLILPAGDYAEIKTCYRVDQLGRCNNCDAKIASIEPNCPECNSTNIKRNNDSKWLIGIRNEAEFAQILEPKSYYLVLFEVTDLQSPDDIQASIWEVDPKLPGFAYCMVDYRMNIQSNSTSKAPFNLWPYKLKFCLMRPKLIYRSTISTRTDSITTEIFPGRDNPKLHQMDELGNYSQSRNLTLEKISSFASRLGMQGELGTLTKQEALKTIQEYIDEKSDIRPEDIADELSYAMYFQDIEVHMENLEDPLKGRILAINL